MLYFSYLWCTKRIFHHSMFKEMFPSLVRVFNDYAVDYSSTQFSANTASHFSIPSVPIRMSNNNCLT